MTTSYANILEKGSRFKKLLAISATALVATVALATPSWAAVTPNTNHTITVFPERDMVGVEGYEATGKDMIVVIRRNGVEIGRAQGPTITTAGGPGLEVNHGPLGAAQPGDCWNVTTPDILPGDVVEVYYDGAVTPETTVTAGVTITGGPTEVTLANQADFPGNDVGDIVLKGRAFDAAAATPTPLPIGELAEEVRDLSSGFRGDPDFLDYDAANNPDGTNWTATYRPPFENNVTGTKDVAPVPGETPAETDARRKQAILDGGHAIVWSNAALNETTIFEQGEAGGPAPGCDAPAAKTAMTSLSRTVVNKANENQPLTVGGVATPDITNVRVSLNGNNYDVAPSNGTWQREIPGADILALGEGDHVVSAAFTSNNNTAPADNTRNISKDTAAPTFDQNLVRASGTYTGAFNVSLNTNDQNATIFYTTNGTDPAVSNSKVRYQGGDIRINTGSTTFRAVAFDAVNNKSAELSRTYTVNAPQPILQNTSVGLNVSTKAIKLNTRKAISGAVSPANAGNFVTLKVVRPGADLIRRLPLSNGRYSFSYKATVLGTHRVSVSFAQDADSKGSTSAVKTFRVIR